MKYSNDLVAPYAISPEQIRFFQENGYIKLKNVLDKETLVQYGKMITEAVFRLNTLVKPMEERTTYERAFLQVMNLWQESEAIKTFVFSQKLARIAADLLQVQGVRLYHDQALYKEPSGGITPWHADQFYWPLSSEKTVTVWIPLQETPLEMGPLAFAPKSQQLVSGRDMAISDESEQQLAATLQEFPLEESMYELGEVSFHAGWTYHRAGANQSDTARKVMTMIYMDKDIKVATPQNSFQEKDWEKWLDKKEIGNTPDSHLNPVLYSVEL
jgi:ectoine hydroxylase-related dioxygenase (phytanoyl-CoA dioxygenase family)